MKGRPGQEHPFVQLFYSDVFELPLPNGHRFPMAKYRLLRERFADHPPFSLALPPATTDSQLGLAHAGEYIEKVKTGTLSPLEIRRIGFPWSPAMVERSRRSTGASVAAGRAALEEGVAANLAGGTHHAFADSGQGYCVFNDVCVAARVLQEEGRVRQVLVVDCDVHQGNGTAEIAKEDPSLFTFSMHCDRNYPFRKAESDFDLALPEGTGDQTYLAQLELALHQIEIACQPELVFYLAGADPFEHDRLGLLSLTKAGLRERDRLVFEFFERRGVPVAIAMAGGYAPQLKDIVDIHATTVLTGKEVFSG